MAQLRKAQEYRDRAAFLRHLAKSNPADVAASLMRIAAHYDEIAERFENLERIKNCRDSLVDNEAGES